MTRSRHVEPAPTIEAEWGRLQAAELHLSIVEQLSHDLQNPLTAMTGYLQMVLDRDSPGCDGETTRMLTQTFHSARWVSQVLNSFVTAARIDAGKLSVQVEPTDLGVLMDKVLAMVGAPAQIKAQRLVVDLPRPLPLVAADRYLLDQALTNLLSLCIRRAALGEQLQVQVRATEGWVSLRLSAPRVLVGLSDRWLRGSGSGAEVLASFRGAELWLALARQVIKLGGGRMDMETEVDGHDAVFVDLLNAAYEPSQLDRET